MWSAPHSEIVFRLLRELAHSLGPGQRCTDSSPGSTALAGESDCLTSGRRLAPSLRTSTLKSSSIEPRIIGDLCAHLKRTSDLLSARVHCPVLGLRLIQRFSFSKFY